MDDCCRLVLPYNAVTASNLRNRSLMTLPEWGQKVLLLAIIPVPRFPYRPIIVHIYQPNMIPMYHSAPDSAHTPIYLWSAKVDFFCYTYLVGHIFICSCILFFWLCYIPFVGAYIYLFLYNLRFLCTVFICWCKLFLVPASFQFVYA